jgi:hypothetical protein
MTPQAVMKILVNLRTRDITFGALIDKSQDLNLGLIIIIPGTGDR